MAKDCSFCRYYKVPAGGNTAIDDRECHYWGDCPYGNDSEENGEEDENC